MQKIQLTLFILCLFLLRPLFSIAQTPTDMQFIQRGVICASATYNYNSWNKYWQGTKLISNGNVGTVTHQTAMVGASIGLLDRLNLIFAVPYMWTNASQGTLNGQHGFQDLMLDVKGNYAHWQLGPGKLTLGGDLGFSTPLSSYLVDFAPLNIGLGTTNLSYRQFVNYKLDKGFYVEARGNYTWRSNIPNIHRDAYFDQGNLYFTNEVKVPDVIDWSAALGYTDIKMLAELSYNQTNTLGGSDIRVWDPGFPTNKVNASVIQARYDYYPKPTGFNLSGKVGYTVAGRNVGQSWYAALSINYLFRAWEKKEDNVKPVQ